MSMYGKKQYNKKKKNKKNKKNKNNPKKKIKGMRFYICMNI